MEPENANEQLQSNLTEMVYSRVKGRRTVILSTRQGNETMEGGKSYNIFMSPIDENTVIVPETIELEFTPEVSGTKSFFKNNVNRILFERMVIKLAGAEMYNSEESVFLIYKNLWLTKEEREDMTRYGIASEGVRKLWSGFDPAPTRDEDVLLAKNTPKLRVKLDRVFSRNGAMYPYGLGQIILRITFLKAEEVLDVASGSTLGQYTLWDVALRFESITCTSLEPEDVVAGGNNLAANVKSSYMGTGKQIYFQQPVKQYNEVWSKDDTIKNLRFNAPIQMLDAIVLLFKNEDSTDSEEFVSANIQKIEVSIERRQGMLFEGGIKEHDLYQEARRLFGKKLCLDEINKVKFETNAYAAVMDFRTVDQDNVIASGIAVKGTQYGVGLKITKRPTTKNLRVFMYRVAFASFVIKDGISMGLIY